MIDKRAPLPWVEAQDQPRRGRKEIENGAHGAVLSKQTPQKPRDTTTAASRNHTVICPHPGEKTQYIQHTISHQEHNKTHCFCQNPLVISNHRERRACAEWHEPAAERTAHSRRRKADGLALDLQSPRAYETKESPTGPTTYSHNKQYNYTNIISEPKTHSNYPRPPLLRMPVQST